MAINERVKALSVAIQQGMVLDTDNQLVSADDKAYEANLPEELTMEVVNKVGEYNTDFVAATANAFGNIAIEAFEKNSGLSQLSTTVPMAGKDKVSHTISREKTYRNPADQDAAPIVKKGVMSTTLEVKAGSNSGQLKSVRTMLSELAASQL